MFALLVMCLLIIFILRVDSKTESTKWLITIVFFVFIAIFSVSWEDDILPLLTTLLHLDEKTNKNLMLVNSLCTSIPQYYLPYMYVMYCISFLEKPISLSRKLFLNIALLIPPTLSLFLLPLKPNSYRTFEESKEYFRILAFWSIPYLLFGWVLIFYSYKMEINPKKKFHKKLTLYIASVLISIITINYYILRPSGLLSAWKYAIPVIILAYTVFIILAVRYGLMGVRIKFEKLSMENMIKKIASGSEMLNHTLKNEVVKIKMATSNIKYSANIDVPDIDDINENLKVIEYSTNYLKKIVEHIRNFTKDIDIVESVNSLNQLISQAISNTEVYGKGKKISINYSPTTDLNIKCDSLQVIEILTNLIKNAYEAIPKKGSISVWYKCSKNALSVYVEDTGSGIKNTDLTHVFEPYFSTKEKGNNFGIGLSFCYLAMKKHQGNIKIYSDKDKGTTVMLIFPPNRIISQQ